MNVEFIRSNMDAFGGLPPGTSFTYQGEVFYKVIALNQDGANAVNLSGKPRLHTFADNMLVDKKTFSLVEAKP